MYISSCTYSIQPTLAGYDLNIVFFNDVETPLSTKTFSFAIPEDESCISHEKESAEEEQMVDFYSQNGTCSEDILKRNKLFKANDADNISLAAGIMQEQELKGTKAFVLDLKDRNTGYREGSTIAKCEEVVCDFFKGKRYKASSVAQKIKLTCTPDFIFCEGSMKVGILKNFSLDQIEFLHTKEGSKDFCQITEIFINSFKFGHWSALQAEDFIRPITGKALKPCRRSIVLYPEEYASMYALTGSFFTQVMAPLFIASGKRDERGITIAHVVKV